VSLDFYVAALCNLGFTLCGSYLEQVWPPLVQENSTAPAITLRRPVTRTITVVAGAVNQGISFVAVPTKATVSDAVGQ